MFSNIGVGKKYFYVAICLSIFLLGCQTIKAPAPTQWEVKTTRTGYGRFEAENLQLRVLDEKTAAISGKIIYCDYEEETTRSRINYRVSTNYPFFIPVSELRSWKENESLGKKWITYNLKEIQVYLPYGLGSGSRVGVLYDGQFNAKVYLSDKYYFKKPMNYNKYYSIKELNDNDWVYIEPLKGPDYSHYTDFTKHINLPILYYLELDSSLTRNYWKTMFQEVTIDIRDKSTRVPIFAQIQVTGINVPTKEEFLQIFTKEYNDIAIAKNELIRIPNYIQQGQTNSTDGYSIKFIAPIGSKYKIETINSQYYYFSGIIDINKDTSNNKTVLVIDKGKKIIIENSSKENQGEIIETR